LRLKRIDTMKVFEALNKARNLLTPVLKDRRFAYTASETLLMHVLKIEKEKLYVIIRDELPAAAYKKFMPLVKRRVKGEPLQYLLGYWWFYGRRFEVKKGVLIPRQDTEAVIEAVKSLAPVLSQGVKAADVGSGTGIIGITLKLEIPELGEIWCIDKSGPAISLTRRNARKNSASIRLVQGDFFAFAAHRKPRFNLVVSNPPYVKLSALKGLQDEVKREPRSALAAKRQGMEFYMKFAQCGSDYLLPGGYLVLEIGDGMAAAIRRVFKRREWRYVNGFRDFRGKLRAMVFKYLG
jgi:release factor glutamine methyltransferase